MLKLLRFFVAPLLGLLGWFPLHAHQIQSPCETMEYENHNQIDYAAKPGHGARGPLRVGSVWGTTKDLLGAAVPGACVGIFSEPEHRLLSVKEADSDGNFEIGGLPNGRYRLIVRFGDFCTANAAIALKNKFHAKKKLAVIMGPRGIHSCSWIQLK